MNGAIIAGGLATRFGGKPKGLELVHGARILDRLVDSFLDAFGVEPLLIANVPEGAGWRPGLRTVRDVIPSLGALGGIYTAVKESPAPVVLVAWDMPFVTPALLTALASGLENADACLPESDGPRGVEPLCAAYGPAVGPAIEAGLARGDRRAIAFHDSVRVAILNGEKIRSLGDPGRLFFNVNTAEDLERANRMTSA
ncbi:MAG TPA: molybdenum cofactor guanylyltransferase [Gemmatimonadales bacterium]|nr:molybdenum cofactor guanylyltransferase [Gemmatimonadales bacterium]